MQVLLKNPEAKENLIFEGIIPTFWSQNAYFLSSDFSLATFLSQSETFKYSPFLSLDARISFLISQLSSSLATYARNLGALGVVALRFTHQNIEHNEDPQKVKHYAEEYLPENSKIAFKGPSYQEVVVFNEQSIDLALWGKLEVGGYYLLGSIDQDITINLSSDCFEAVGRLWPFGEASEFGWIFCEEDYGLKNFRFLKIKKIK